MTQVRDVSIERLDGVTRTADNDRIVVEAPLQLRARGAPVATIMRTPGHDLELVRGLLHAESIALTTHESDSAACSDASGGTTRGDATRGDATRDDATRGDVARSGATRGDVARSGATRGDATRGDLTRMIRQVDEDAVDIDIDPSVFVGRGLLASAACGVCGRVAIADLELRAKEITRDTRIDRAVLATLPDALRSAQSVFAQTGGLHAAALFTTRGELIAAREDVGRHNAVDKLVGWALEQCITPDVLFLSGRLGYELVQKAIMLGVPIVAAVSAPSSLAVELAERFNVALVGFVRGNRANLYAHGWRIG